MRLRQMSTMLQGRIHTYEHTYKRIYIYYPCLAHGCSHYVWFHVCLSLRFSVENAYIDEKEDACDALGEIAFSTG